MNSKLLAALLIGGALIAAQAPKPRPAAARPALPAISPAALASHVSFLASDPLAGRETPSPGLDIAAEYIASQFRRAGLKPGLDRSYFQTARVTVIPPDPEKKKGRRVRLLEDGAGQGEEARNVIGVLPGSDPALKDTCVLLSAHYDHIGTAASGDDRIYNGANDNASGVAAVIETAAALASRRARPRRTVVFIAFFGEEQGMLGSRYYARHPACPLEKTAAHVNLEQVGRTDDTEGPQIASVTLTGFELSGLPAVLQAAGNRTAVKVYKRERAEDKYFLRSDNLPLAQAGVPAHTLAATFGFPDYHGLDDEWDRLDYRNMARITRTVMAGVLELANSPGAPEWNPQNPEAEPYLR
ncbi:MAG: M20/M25/M40 family metallo-hydrolase, partial [Acidobacteria bacterium]|nr:M20/M25/M40 family metallo-hydrolase [Acidobacteriota bacterium]